MFKRSLIVVLVMSMVVASGAFAQPYTIGVSNSFVGSEWRTQMIENLKEVNSRYMEEGLTNELVIQNQTVQVQGQIQQIRNLMNRGVDAIIVNPNSQSGLNQVIADAEAAGIEVISVDQQVSAPQAVNVVINQTEWARTSARWLATQLGGEGDVVVINGLAGHPANEARSKGVKDVFGHFPDIDILNTVNAGWDQATAQQKMSNILAAQPDIDAVWTQDGMAVGVLRAVRAANLDEWPILMGEARAGYIQLWHEVQQDRPNFTTYGVINPPGIAASGLKIAVDMLQGKELKEGILTGPFDNSIYQQIPGTVSKHNFDQEYAKHRDKSSAYTLDGIMTEAEAESFFK